MDIPMKRDLIEVDSLSEEDVSYIFNTTEKLKKSSTALLHIGSLPNLLGSRTLGMIFAKPSTRTRVSFEVAMNHLGGHAIYLNWNDIQLGRGETITDTARVLSRYVDILMARLFSHKDIIELAEHANVPVINGLTDMHHPCQAMADVFTIKEKFGELEGLKLTYIGDGYNNVTHSLMQACHKAGIDMVVSCPKNYDPDRKILSDTHTKIVRDPEEAVRNADVIYTDTWVSMGREKEARKRLKDFKGYQVDTGLVRFAKPSTIIMHCLPAHRGEEITSEVMDSRQSVVFEQAENRLHVQKGILLWCLGK